PSPGPCSAGRTPGRPRPGALSGHPVAPGRRTPRPKSGPGAEPPASVPPGPRSPSACRWPRRPDIRAHRLRARSCTLRNTDQAHELRLRQVRSDPHDPAVAKTDLDAAGGRPETAASLRRIRRKLHGQKMRRLKRRHPLEPHLPTPLVDMLPADLVPSRYSRHRRAAHTNLADNLPLLVDRPASAALDPDQNLLAHHPPP